MAWCWCLSLSEWVSHSTWQPWHCPAGYMAMWTPERCWATEDRGHHQWVLEGWTNPCLPYVPHGLYKQLEKLNIGIWRCLVYFSIGCATNATGLWRRPAEAPLLFVSLLGEHSEALPTTPQPTPRPGVPAPSHGHRTEGVNWAALFFQYDLALFLVVLYLVW